jgi:hypothetical protein
MFMAIYGIENVRGGSFCSMKLSHSEKTVLSKMIDSASDKCFKCGSTDHFARDCENLANTEAKLNALKTWCLEMSKDAGQTFVLLIEGSNEKYEYSNGNEAQSEIPDTKDRFAKRLARKHDTTLFKYSVSSFDFHIKTLSSKDHQILFNSEGTCILCNTEAELSKVCQAQVFKSIESMVETSEFVKVDIST